MPVDFNRQAISGRVFKGRWNRRDVALKVLKTDAGEIPKSEAIRLEVHTWSKLRHPHVLQFLGANVLDENPFIVMPLLKNGDSRNFVRTYPNFNLLRLVCQFDIQYPFS